jgi:hypothetical protein
MKTLLVACPACMRHIRVTEERCPFCGSDMPSSLREQETPAPVGRLSRAALYALRAGALSMTAAACGGAVAGGPGRENSSSASFAPSYGSMAVVDASVPVLMDASGGALYGGFFPEPFEDAGETADVMTGPVTAASYGGFFASEAGSVQETPDGSQAAGPADASEEQTDATDDHEDGQGLIGPVPAYGGPR